MKHLVIIVVFLFSFGVSSASILLQDQYRSHRVQKGETVYSLAKKYGISEETIYRLNPDARKGIGESNILILPGLVEVEEVKEVKVQVDFKKHRVKRKETLFSISQKYGITEDDIKKYNKHLYSKELKKGEKIRIPIFSTSTENNTAITSGNTELNSNNGGLNIKIHVVQAQETKYGIARKYGMTMAEIETLNPDLAPNLPIGTELKVKGDSIASSAAIEESEFDFYEVLPKEGFFRLKLKLGLSQEDIIALNPYAEDGLKEGMILKIPKKVSDNLTADVMKVDLENAIVNTETKHVAVLLPFQLRKMEMDSTGNENVIKNNRTMRIALDFYSGVLMATEFAKDKGISVVLDVYDTEGSGGKIDELLISKDFSETQAVIGPLLSKNVQKAANRLKNDNVPVFSPLSNKNLKLTSNLFQTLPSDELLQQAMISFVKENNADKNMILISDKTKSKVKSVLVSAFPGITVLEPREKGFLYMVDIDEKMDKDKENWVFLESKDPVIVSNVVGLLNGMKEARKVRLFTTDRNNTYDYEDISNMHLANLDFTFPSVSKSYDFDDKNAFLISYKNKYGVLPNRFVVRGFDVTYDVLLRLAAEGNVYDASDSDFETEYVENKFRYSKKMFSGYTNNAFYILKYNKELQFDIVK